MVHSIHPEHSLILVLRGQDKGLVDSRRWVLEKAGFCVETALSLTALDGMTKEIELFLLCDSLSPEARLRALALIQARWPAAKRLVLSPYGHSVDLELAEKVFPAIEGPGKLITAVHALIADRPASEIRKSPTTFS